MERLLESIQRKIASKRTRHTPAHDPSREDVGEEGHVDEARPRGDVGEIRHSKRIRTIGGEVPLNEIRRSKGRMIGDRGLERSAAYDALEAHLTHPPLYRASGDFDPFSAKLTPDFARTVDAEVLLPDPARSPRGTRRREPTGPNAERGPPRGPSARSRSTGRSEAFCRSARPRAPRDARR